MTTSKLFAAMAAAFPEIEGATKANENAAFKNGGKASKYADLSSVVEAIKPALVKNKLFFSQVNHEQTGGVCIETIVCHESGEQMSFGKLFVPAGKQDAQGYGSALTYARRYSLMTAFGVCPEDDDGNAAAKSPNNDRGDMPVSEEQFHTLQELAVGVGADLQKFCQYMRVASLKAIPARRFDEAKSALEAKRKAA